MTIFKPLSILSISTNGAPAKCEKRKGVSTGMSWFNLNANPQTSSFTGGSWHCNMLLDLNAVLKETVKVGKLPSDTKYTHS